MPIDAGDRRPIALAHDPRALKRGSCARLLLFRVIHASGAATFGDHALAHDPRSPKRGSYARLLLFRVIHASRVSTSGDHALALAPRWRAGSGASGKCRTP
jgi:hypothetical protein